VRLTVAAALCLVLAACAQGGPTPSPAADATSSPTPDQVASGPRFSQPPVTPPTPPVTNIPAFACADSGGGITGVAHVTDVRVGRQVDYDRFVIQFDDAVPTYTVKRQARPTFPMGATGQTITLSGTAGAVVTVHSATEALTYSGPTDITHSDFPVVKEARLTQDFEGSVTWALGLDHPACLRTFTLANPARLVVDFSTATS